jgi:DnaJ family protein C protein 7
MKFFSKISSKTSKSADDENDEHLGYPDSSQPPSPTKSPTKSTGSRSPTKKASSQRPASPPDADSKPQSPRASRPFTRYPTNAGLSSSRRKKIDPDTHPLNLPPEQRKRLSELSAFSARNSMDTDKEPVNGGNRSSPPPQQSQPQPQQQQQRPSNSAPQPPPPNSYTVPVTNGTAASTNGAADEAVPAPPPHRSQPSSPVQSEAEQAELFKNEGNKFFKAGDYTRAIEFYTKGESNTSVLWYNACRVAAS